MTAGRTLKKAQTTISTMSTNPFDDDYREPAKPQRPPGIGTMSSFAKSATSVSNTMSEEEEVQLALALSASETSGGFQSMIPGLSTHAIDEPQPPQSIQQPPQSIQPPMQQSIQPPIQQPIQPRMQQPVQQMQPAARAISTQITLRLSARGIPKLDTLSKSDPQVIFYIVQAGNWVEVGRTEIIQDCHEPVWQKMFVLDYIPSIEQQMRFLMLDIDEPASLAIEKQDVIGQVNIDTFG
jgi:hypothetical protein